MTASFDPSKIQHDVVLDTKSYGLNEISLFVDFFELFRPDFQEYFDHMNPNEKGHPRESREAGNYGVEDSFLKGELMVSAIKRAGFLVHQYDSAQNRHSKNRNAGNLISWDFKRVAEKISLESGIAFNPEWEETLESLADERKMELVPNR